MEEVTITYEILFDILRREKNHEELQELDANFYDQVVLYMQEKKKIADSHTHDDEIEQHKSLIQLQNIKKILKELYERRERKLINMALAEVRTRNTLVDTSTILPSEQHLYDALKQLLAQSRDGVLYQLLQFNPIRAYWADVSTASSSTGSSRTASHSVSNIASDSSSRPEKTEKSSVKKEDSSEEERSANDSEETTPASTVSSTKMVRFLKSIPKFVGTEMEVYGPFKEDDMANLPSLIADVLIKKGRAEEVAT